MNNVNIKKRIEEIRAVFIDKIVTAAEFGKDSYMFEIRHDDTTNLCEAIELLAEEYDLDTDYNRYKGRDFDELIVFIPEYFNITEEDEIMESKDKRDDIKHPLQPVEKDSRGTLRFKENKIVSRLLEVASKHGYDLNEIAKDNFKRRSTTICTVNWI